MTHTRGQKSNKERLYVVEVKCNAITGEKSKWDFNVFIDIPDSGFIESINCNQSAKKQTNKQKTNTCFSSTNLFR